MFTAKNLREILLPSSTMKRRLEPPLVGLAYIAAIYLLGGMKDRHVIIGLLGLLDLYNERTRRFLNYFAPFIFTGVAYDSMRYYYWWGIEGHIHIAEPYELEKKLFGILLNGKLVTPNEYFEVFTHKILDFFCGLAYITFVAEYLGFGIILYFMKKYRVLRTLGWSFFLVNVMGFATYYIYPAAPPWYITKYGFGPAQMYIGSTPAAAVRFDQLLGTHFFDTMYSQSVDVYGAIPSLHVAYPLLVAWSALAVGFLRVPAVFFYFLMCFAAVYLQHHYIIDIILGTLYAITALLTVRYFQERIAARKLAAPARASLRSLLWVSE